MLSAERGNNLNGSIVLQPAWKASGDRSQITLLDLFEFRVWRMIAEGAVEGRCEAVERLPVCFRVMVLPR